jgi:hypothetical protein
VKLHTIFISLLFSLFTLSCFSQEDLPVSATPKTEEFPLKKKYYLFSPRVSVTVPHPIADKSFKKCFVGIYEVSAGLNIFFYKGLFVGVTGKNGLLKITENKIADYNARMQINNVKILSKDSKEVGHKENINHYVPSSKIRFFMNINSS